MTRDEFSNTTDNADARASATPQSSREAVARIREASEVSQVRNARTQLLGDHAKIECTAMSHLSKIPTNTGTTKP